MSFEKPIRFLFEGIGSINYTSPAGAAPGFINVAGARNGLIYDATTKFIELGQPLAGSGADLLHDSFIPMHGFSLNLDGDNGNVDINAADANTVDTAILITPTAPASTFQAIQTTNPTTQGNYYWTLDQTFHNPDDSIDQVIFFGFNITPGGGVVLGTEWSFRDAWESNFISGPGQTPQFERHIQFSAPDGTTSRVYSSQMKKGFPITAATQFRSDDFTFSPTDDSFVLIEFVDDGFFNFAGRNNGALFRLTDTDDTTTFQIQATGGFIIVTGAPWQFETPIQVGINTNDAITKILTLSNASNGDQAFAQLTIAMNGFNTDLTSVADTNTLLTNLPPWSKTGDFQIQHGLFFDTMIGNSNGQIVRFQNGDGASVNDPRIAIGEPAGAIEARVHITPGTADAASILMEAGVVLTTPISGAIEFDGTNFYGTIGGVRKTFTLL